MLVRRFALVLSCTRLGAARDDLFLTEDLSIQCWVSSMHQMYILLLGVPLFLLYIVGIIYGAWYLLSHPNNYKHVLRIIQAVPFLPPSPPIS